MKHIVLASVSVLAIAAAPAYAQTGAQDAPVPQSTPGANAPQGAAPSTVAPTPQSGLEDIIVTAQRTEETAQRAPLAIAVVKPEELVRQNVTRAEDLSRIVPALVATASGGPNTTFFLRGVGNTTANSYSDPAISFNYDGVTIGRPNATQGFFYDLQRVEVLKGPQGTLYGRNATGGAINVIPNRPKLGVYEAEFQASYGNYDAVVGQAAVNLPIGEFGAFRLSGALARHDGYLSDGTADQDSKSVRAQLLVDLTPDLTTRVGADFSHQGGAGTGSYIYGTYAYNPANRTFSFTPTPQLGAEVGVHDPRTEAFVQTRFIAQVGRNSEATGSYPSSDNSVWGVTNETNWRTGVGTLTVQAAYRVSNVDSLSTTSNFRGFFIREDTDQFTLEARLAGKVGTAADYLIGTFLFDENIQNSTAINQITSNPFQDYRTGTNSKALFGRLGLHLTDTLTFTAGGRYTDDSKSMNGLSNVFTLNCGNPMAPPQDICSTFPLAPLVRTAAEFRAFYVARGIPVGNNPPGGPTLQPPPVLNAPRILNNQIPINTVLDTEKFTYRLAADWQVTPSNLVYASFETGFHSGGFNFGRGLETYAPEEIEAYTIGTKNRFLDNRLQINIEGFYWRYRDQQVSQFGTDFSTPPISVFYTTNIGRSTIKGFDVDAEALITPTTRFSANIQYLDTSYDTYSFLVSAASPTAPNFACPFTLTTVYTVNCSGKPSLYSPRWTLNYTLEQTFRFDRYKLIAQGGTRWRGDFFAATSFQPWTISRAAFQSDASLTLAPEGDAWFASVFVNNIEDKRRITQSNVNATLFTQSAISTPPRTYGLRIGARFK